MLISYRAIQQATFCALHRFLFLTGPPLVTTSTPGSRPGHNMISAGALTLVRVPRVLRISTVMPKNMATGMETSLTKTLLGLALRQRRDPSKRVAMFDSIEAGLLCLFMPFYIEGRKGIVSLILRTCVEVTQQTGRHYPAYMS